MTRSSDLDRREYLKYMAGGSTTGLTRFAGTAGGSGGGNANASSGDGGGLNLVISSFQQRTGWYVMASDITDTVTPYLRRTRRSA